MLKSELTKNQYALL